MRQPVYSGDQQHDIGNGFSYGMGKAMDQFSNAANSGREPGRSNVAANHLATFIFLKFNIQSRASIIITASFSVTASTFVMLSIIYGSWRSSKRAHRPRIRRRFEFLRHVPSTNTIPLVFSFSSILQSSILIGVQSTGLQNVFADGCLASSQITWTAVWIIGYAVLTFTSDAVYQSFRPSQSAATKRRRSLICWVAVTIMLLLTWLPSKIREREKDRCLATLLQWTTRWSDIGLALTIGLIVLFIVNGAILSVKLWRTAKLDIQERIATSSIVYYLAGTAIIFTLVLPFWIQATFLQGVSNFSLLMGSIALNLFGILYAFIYLLFCANGRNMMIGPVASTWSKELSKRHDSTERALIPQINQPIIAEKRSGSPLEKNDFLSEEEDGLEEPRILKTRSPKPAAFSSISMPRPIVLHSRKPSSYSLFPTRISSRNTRRFILNSNDSHEDILAPPRPSYAHHRRFSSDVSAATVQIGLRLSNIALPAHIQNHNSSTTSLGLYPIQAETPIHLSSIENRSPGVARSRGSQKELGPSAGSQTAFSLNQNSGYFGRISPLSQNPPGPEIRPPFYAWRSPVTKTEEASTNKKDILPPAPLRISKGDSYFPNDPSPLAQATSILPTPSQSSWPLPGRLSLLPDKTFKQPAHWI
ncbi:hypothetical protein GX51_02241 [Blastomyces parvus]|uniref:Uncharacterized protein n=1 Tax=Blastomyces parvus TaxID=2060905 RepID=A0A2B7X4P2_9EURO|nr:hypothetical protein GX51_02241 [Blastomyces parvus]